MLTRWIRARAALLLYWTLNFILYSSLQNDRTWAGVNGFFFFFIFIKPYRTVCLWNENGQKYNQFEFRCHRNFCTVSSYDFGRRAIWEKTKSERGDFNGSKLGTSRKRSVKKKIKHKIQPFYRKCIDIKARVMVWGCCVPIICRVHVDYTTTDVQLA